MRILPERSEMIIAQVHALARHAKAAAAARRPSADSGVLGWQVIIETGSPAALPLGDWVADLCVAADVTEVLLSGRPAAWIASSPWIGPTVRCRGISNCRHNPCLAVYPSPGPATCSCHSWMGAWSRSAPHET